MAGHGLKGAGGGEGQVEQIGLHEGDRGRGGTKTPKGAPEHGQRAVGEHEWPVGVAVGGGAEDPAAASHIEQRPVPARSASAANAAYVRGEARQSSRLYSGLATRRSEAAARRS